MTDDTLTCIACNKTSNVKEEFSRERHGVLTLTLCVDYKECISRHKEQDQK